MKFKLKVISIALSLALSSTSITTFADDFNPQVAFSNYKSYDELVMFRNLYKVSNSENKSAIFYQDKQLTEFLYDTISYVGDESFIVSQNINGVEAYGLIDEKYICSEENKDIKNISYSLPIKYKSIQYKQIKLMNVYIAENFDGTKEYYLSKYEFDSSKKIYGDNGTFNISYVDCGKLLRINSLDDVPKRYKETAIKGLNNVYIQDTITNGYYIVDKDGNKLIDMEFREIDNKLSPGGTLVVRYPVGMSDSTLMVLSKDLKVIVPNNYYGLEPTFLESNGQIYIKVNQVIASNETHYYDLQGNKSDKAPPNAKVVTEYVEDNNNKEDTTENIKTPNKNGEKVAIKGLENTYVKPDYANRQVDIVDKDGNILGDLYIRAAETTLGPGDTLIVSWGLGHSDSTKAVLNKDLKPITETSTFVKNIDFVESQGKIYVRVEEDKKLVYYDLEGNKLDKAPSNAKIITKSSMNKGTVELKKPYSNWAESSIKEAILTGLVPENLQSNYTNKITRQEFCRLVMELYNKRKEEVVDSQLQFSDMDMNAKSPFTDVNDPYVTAAYNLKIVSGTGKGKFSPNNFITRQEAAVMLNNLAQRIGLYGEPRQEKFVDEKYFADWAKQSIYLISGTKSGDNYIMEGTGQGKFSPWYNYTREQAITTMLRMYNKR